MSLEIYFKGGSMDPEFSASHVPGTKNKIGTIAKGDVNDALTIDFDHWL